MNEREKPMPLSELPDYMKSIREKGQGDYVPVVEMGRIIDDSPRGGWLRYAGYASAACILIAGGLLMSTKSLVIASKADPAVIAKIVSDEGASVFSVSQKEDGTYKVRILSLRSLNSILDRLREKKELDKVDGE